MTSQMTKDLSIESLEAMDQDHAVDEEDDDRTSSPHSPSDHEGKTPVTSKNSNIFLSSSI